MARLSLILSALFICIVLTSCSSECNNRSCVNKNDGAKIAKVKIRQIDDLLTQASLLRKENAVYREVYERNRKSENSLMNKSLDALSSPDKSMKDFVKDLNIEGSLKDKELLEELGKGELALIIDELFQKEYDMVYCESYDEDIVYSKVRIHDITPQIMFHLRKVIAGENQQ